MELHTYILPRAQSVRKPCSISPESMLNLPGGDAQSRAEYSCETGVFCEEHRKEWSHDALRGGAAARGYDARWREARKLFLRLHPLCVECLRENKLTPATVVDHIIPHRGDKELFWNQENWQPLCKDCHDRKTGSGR